MFDFKVSRLLLMSGASTLGGLLSTAAALGNRAFVSLLLEFGADADERNADNSDTALISAAKLGDSALVQMLVEAG